ncbi:Hypothetical predicted protein [Podarcis lilfordi]|uniref:Uncharacterized protein n=1 Tax=Podarcis lilfordi TaxID=74358 RepID=A0AA35K5C6_9SAUR|nr:Hypothetical predicted protein [Podarcis lilfordi]
MKHFEGLFVSVGVKPLLTSLPLKLIGFKYVELYLDSTQYLISPEAVGFLSAVGLFIILLLILFLYINKKMCFENVGGFPDLNSRYNARKNSQDKLYNSYINKDQHGSSSESEDEALGKYHEALSRTQSSRPPAGDNRQQKNYIWETRQKYSPLSAEYDGYSSEASIDEGKHNE